LGGNSRPPIPGILLGNEFDGKECSRATACPHTQNTKLSKKKQAGRKGLKHLGPHPKAKKHQIQTGSFAKPEKSQTRAGGVTSVYGPQARRAQKTLTLSEAPEEKKGKNIRGKKKGEWL